MMKSNKQSLFGIALLASAAAFTACSSDEAIIDEAVTQPEETPVYTGETVKTQFAINLPYAAANKRMTEDHTQGAGTLPNGNGLQNINLIMHTAAIDGNTTFVNRTQLGDFTAFDNGNNVKVYSDVNVPVGTKNFLFYGQAKYATAADNFAGGVLEDKFNGATSTSQLTFNLKAISQTNELTAVERRFTNLLNSVANVTGWSDLQNQANNTLGKLYSDFTGLKAGSANSILNTLTDLYNAVEPLKTAEENDIATAIQNAIKGGSTDNIQITVEGDAAPYTLAYASSMADEISTFPAKYDLPDGAVHLNYANGFTYATTSIGSGDNTINIEKICYPSSLNYFTNTPLKASNTNNPTWPTTANWESSFTDWGDAVLASTQTVALRNNIQYSVANLKLGVKCTTATLEAKAPTPAAGGQNTTIHVSVPDNGIKVTGILIGGQPEKVDYQFNATTATEAFPMTVYDRDIVTGVAIKQKNSTEDPEVYNYTLLLANTKYENGAVATNQENKVHFAIECENNTDTEFLAQDGKVAKNAKFYLIGSLDPKATTGVTLPTGVTNPSVFMKDYQTTANVTVSSLKNAYVVIPDLRSTKFQLGLSVDLTWQAGIVFNVDIE